MRNLQYATKRYSEWKEKHITRRKYLMSGLDLHGKPVSEEIEVVTYDRLLRIIDWIEFKVRWLIRKPKIRTISGIAITKNQYSSIGGNL